MVESTAEYRGEGEKSEMVCTQTQKPDLHLCPVLPVVYRVAYYKQCYMKVFQIMLSDKMMTDPVECNEAIKGFMDQVAEDFVKTALGEYRNLLSHLIFRAPYTNASTLYCLTKFAFLASIQSTGESNLPLHEVMIVHSTGSDDILPLAQELIQLYPEAALQPNKNGHIPLHHLLETSVWTHETIHLTKDLLVRYPQSASIPTQAGKLPIHLVLQHPDPYPEIVESLVQVHPRGAVEETVDELIQLCIGSQSSQNDSTRHKKIIVWTPLLRAEEKGYTKVVNAINQSLHNWVMRRHMQVHTGAGIMGVRGSMRQQATLAQLTPIDKNEQQR